MRVITTLLAAGVFFISTTGFAASVTSLDSKWTCKTNASSSSVDADKAADKQMSETAKSAADAFTFASQNCRDCTKITCEASN
jgi:hypothetical protein